MSAFSAQAQPAGSLNRNSLLKGLHSRLNNTRSGYKIGRIELAPIRSSAEAIGRYVGGYLSKSIGGRGVDEEKKGSRLVRYSRSCPRAAYSSFSWVGMGAWLWRQKARCWAKVHGCETPEQVLAKFGQHWAYNHREAIMAHEIDYWPTLGHWIADKGQGAVLPGMTDADFPLTLESELSRKKTQREFVREYEIELAMASLSDLWDAYISTPLRTEQVHPDVLLRRSRGGRSKRGGSH